MIPWPNWTTEEWEAKLAGLRGAEFNENQPRDEKGQWTSAFHGTAADNLRSILKDGILVAKSGSVHPEYSSPDHTYVTTDLGRAKDWAYTAAKRIDDRLESEEFERYRASFVGKPTAPKDFYDWQSSQDQREGAHLFPDAAVLQIEIPKEELGKLGFDENFDASSGNLAFKGDVKPEWIKKVWVAEMPEEWDEKLAWQEADLAKFKASAEKDAVTFFVTVLWEPKRKLKTAQDLAFLTGEFRAAFDPSQPRDEHGRWTTEGKGPDESGRESMVGVRTKADTDLERALLLNEAANFTASYGNPAQIDVKGMTVEDRIALLKAYDRTGASKQLYMSDKRYNAKEKAYDEFRKEMKDASAETVLDEGLKRGLFSLEKKGEFTYAVSNTYPVSSEKILGGLTPAERVRMEDGIIEATKTHGLDYSFSDLVGAGWQLQDLERFADKLEAAGRRYHSSGSDHKANYNSLDRLAGDLAFYSKDYDNFEASLFNGWALVGGSSEARVARQIGEDLFPLPEGQQFYKLPYEDANYRKSLGMLDETKFYSPRAVTNMQRLKTSTEDFYKRKLRTDDLTTKPIELQRAIGGHIDAFTPGGLESWTRDSRTVDRFGKLMEKKGEYSALRTTVTYDDVLWSYESAKDRPGWPVEKDLKGKREFVLIGNRIKNVDVDKRYYREKRRY